MNGAITVTLSPGQARGILKGDDARGRTEQALRDEGLEAIRATLESAHPDIFEEAGRDLAKLLRHAQRDVGAALSSEVTVDRADLEAVVGPAGPITRQKAYDRLRAALNRDEE